jgi:anaerobic selenocysteine-containing dehydrogenase
VCSICEAGCGLVFEVEGDRVVDVRNDPDDPHSGGYCCPKGLASGELHHDPDRLRRPLIRRQGELVEASWDEAFEAAIEGLAAVVRERGPHALGFYQGNPVIHRLEAQIGGELLQHLVPTRNRYTANSMDAHPHLIANVLTFGMQLAQPVPDLNRCHTLLILGGNPLVSQGSFMIGPGVGQRLRGISARGGRVIVVDPRRSETARIADRHHSIRPGQDAYLLLALAHVLCVEGLADQAFLQRWARGHEHAQAHLAPFAPERVAPRLGGDWSAEAIRELARELAGSPAAAVYGRMGICATETGGVAAWGLLLVNALLGSLDKPGGMMFPEGPAGWVFRTSHTVGSYDRYRSPQDRPEINGEYPCHVLADQIERGAADPTAPEAILGMLVVAGNPVLSAPNGPRLEAALRKLRFLVVSDIYANETAQLADVVLPPRSSLHEPKFDPILAQLAVADTARWSEAVLPQPADEADQPGELELLRRLGVGISRRSGRATFRQAALRAASGWVTPERFAALGIRFGARGRGLLPFGRGETLATLRRRPHGLEATPLQPRLAERLIGRDRLELFPEPYVRELKRLAQRLDEGPDDELVLIGRRRLKSNNSWFNNLPSMRGGKECTLLVHPNDASRLELTAGGQARVRSRVGELVATVEISDEVMPGVISLPHGWGHTTHGGQVARGAPGVNVNQLVDETRFDPVTGNAALNGVPVQVEAWVPAESLA